MNKTLIIPLLASQLWLQAAAAQEISLTARVDAASAALAQLDVLAADCSERFRSEGSEQALPFCQRFMAAIDGELLASYLEHCEVLKAWREQFIDPAAGGRDDLGPDQALQLMIGVERACGEDALQRRTEHVVSTFALLQGGQNSGQRPTAAIARGFDELEQEALRSSERRALQEALQRQRSRSLFETQRQWDDLEDELLRQQIRNPGGAFLHN